MKTLLKKTLLMTLVMAVTISTPTVLAEEATSPAAAPAEIVQVAPKETAHPIAKKEEHTEEPVQKEHSEPGADEKKVAEPEKTPPPEANPAESEAPKSAEEAALKAGEQPAVEEEPAEEEEAGQEEAEAEPVRAVVITTDEGKIRYGETLTLQAELVGYEGCKTKVQWQVNDGEGWKDVENGDALSLDVQVSETTVHLSWRVAVTEAA